MPQAYTLPRPSHDWSAITGKPDFECRKCYCRKSTEIDTGHLSTGCTELAYHFFPGPNFQLSQYTWDQLDGTRSSHNGHYEPQSESGPTLVPSSAATAPAPAPYGAYQPATKPSWQGDFEIGDRVELIDEGSAEGEIVGFLSSRKMIEVLRDDGEHGSGTTVWSLKHGKHVDTWVCDKDELKLLESGTKLHIQNLPKEEPHKMGLDPETIDWSKFKKIRDML